jgi:hypothetical protein
MLIQCPQRRFAEDVVRSGILPPMATKTRRIVPMPQSLEEDALLRVSDEAGRLVRCEVLRAGTDLRARLQLAFDNLQVQGWSIDGGLRPGSWSFTHEKVVNMNALRH